ncbi:hypothetical protein VNO78_11897 [Psophocarpus tetragonolobus]|uniref:CLAVATA3/ESR (CLE)-related protein n=1 Tax=Psophocarpus tetragonolobus TaxID=3891 RepID=A0AAN9XNK8_PSOTE
MVNLTRFLGCICIILILSAGGSETRPLNPTMVRDVLGTMNSPPIQPVAEEGGHRDTQRLAPGGPDPHHH